MNPSDDRNEISVRGGDTGEEAPVGGQAEESCYGHRDDQWHGERPRHSFSHGVEEVAADQPEVSLGEEMANSAVGAVMGRSSAAEISLAGPFAGRTD